MPTKCQRPKDLPDEIRICHTVPRDFNADLLLKVTALESNKTMVFPVFKEDIIQQLPNFFGRIFDKNKGYRFKENRLQKGEYFEIGIPHLIYPDSFALYLYNFVYSKISMIQKLSKNRSPGLSDNFEIEEWRDFYWIANYFGEEDIVNKVTKVLLKKFNEDFLGCRKKFTLEFSAEILFMIEIFLKSSEKSVLIDNLSNSNLMICCFHFVSSHDLSLSLCAIS